MTYSRRTWANGNQWDATAANDFEGRIETEFGVKATEIAARALQTSVDSADAALDARVDALEAGGGGGGGGGTVTLDTWHTVGAAGEPAFTGSWVNYGSGLQTAQFRKMPDGKVQVRGLVKSGTLSTAVFTLPVGYRPPAQQYFATDNGGTYARVSVPPDGRVLWDVGTGGAGAVSLDVIEFDTDTVSSLVFGPGPSAVTSLPGSPIDGQEVYYIADSTNGVIWHLRYRSGSSSTYKWEFVGGSQLEAVTSPAANDVIGVAAYAALPTTPGPNLTIPLAGEYRIQLECMSVINSTLGAFIAMSYAVGATAASDADSASYFEENATAGTTSLFRDKRKTIPTAATTLSVQFRTNAGSLTVYGTTAAAAGAYRAIRAVPVRVG